MGVNGVIGGDDYWGQALDGPMMREDLRTLGTDFLSRFSWLAVGGQMAKNGRNLNFFAPAAMLAGGWILIS